MADVIEKCVHLQAQLDSGAPRMELVMTDFFSFPLCYLPSWAGSPFMVISSRFTFHHLSGPSGEESVSFSIVPAEVLGWLSLGHPEPITELR